MLSMTAKVAYLGHRCLGSCISTFDTANYAHASTKSARYGQSFALGFHGPKLHHRHASIAVSFFLVCFSHSAVAETYKCIQAGRTIYSSSPCGDNVQLVQEHFTVTQEPPRKIYKEPNSVQPAPPQSLAAPVKAAAPAQVAAPVISCDGQEAAFEEVKKGMRAGYPASQSNYWLERYKKARDAYDLCREQRQKGISGKQYE